MPNLENLLISPLYERTEKQAAEMLIPAPALFSFSSSKWNINVSFISHIQQS